MKFEDKKGFYKARIFLEITILLERNLFLDHLQI